MVCATYQWLGLADFFERCDSLYRTTFFYKGPFHHSGTRGRFLFGARLWSIKAYEGGEAENHVFQSKGLDTAFIRFHDSEGTSFRKVSCASWAIIPNTLTAGLTFWYQSDTIQELDLDSQTNLDSEGAFKSCLSGKIEHTFSFPRSAIGASRCRRVTAMKQMLGEFTSLPSETSCGASFSALPLLSANLPCQILSHAFPAEIESFEYLSGEAFVPTYEGVRFD